MIGLQKVRWPAGLLLAALLIGGCGSPAATPTPTPAEPTAILPAGTAPALTPIYPAPADTAPTAAPTDPATGYPVPVPPTPYPGPTSSGAAPGGTTNTIGLPAAPSATTPVVSAAVVATYPHDPQAYTQGLVYIGADTFYEGTGWYADSSLREVSLASGAVARKQMLSDHLGPDPDGDPAFGEGIAVVGDRIFQLSWKNGVGLVYDLSFKVVGQFTYPPAGQPGPVEGWGLTYDPASGRLIMSDGTATLYFVDPAKTQSDGVLAISGTVAVRDASGNPVNQLNELELVKGEVFANIYGSDRIARIDPATGQVRSLIDLSGLRALMPPTGPEVLNGIAYDEAGDRLFVTGKWWPSLFEIDLPVARAYLPATLVAPATRPTTQWS